MAVFGYLSVVQQQTLPAILPAQAWTYLCEAMKPEADVRKRILALAPGVETRVEIGGGCFALEQAYVGKNRADARFESHRRHIDLQLIVAGVEWMDVRSVKDLQVSEDCTPARDVLFYHPPEHYTSLLVEEGQLAVFGLLDGHRPSLAFKPGAPVWKTVVKVNVG